MESQDNKKWLCNDVSTFWNRLSPPLQKCYIQSQTTFLLVRHISVLTSIIADIVVACTKNLQRHKCLLPRFTTEQDMKDVCWYVQMYMFLCTGCENKYPSGTINLKMILHVYILLKQWSYVVLICSLVCYNLSSLCILQPEKTTNQCLLGYVPFLSLSYCINDMQLIGFWPVLWISIIKITDLRNKDTGGHWLSISCQTLI